MLRTIQARGKVGSRGRSKSLSESSIERAESPAIDGAHDCEIFLRTDNEFSVASGHSEVYDAFFRTSVADITDTAPAVWVPTTSLVPRNLAHLGDGSSRLASS